MNFHLHTNGRQKCTICSKCIPKDVQRISFPYIDTGYTKYIRICAVCIKDLAKDIKKNKAFQLFEHKKIEEEI